MIYETTRKNRKAEEAINDSVGKSFSLIERIKMGGNGCRRMIIEEAHPEIWKIIKDHPGLHYSSIELRPEGIIVFFKYNLRDYSWPIPYYQLALFKSNHFSIHGAGLFVKFKLSTVYPANEKFFERLTKLKNEATG